jgi:cell division protein DivIC
MSLGRFLATLYAIVFLALSLFAGISFVQTHQELNNLKLQQSEAQQRLALAERELRDQEKTLEQLRTDPQFVETMIRRKLGYARSGELVFRFRE